jgi:hypothetical protein
MRLQSSMTDGVLFHHSESSKEKYATCSNGGTYNSSIWNDASALFLTNEKRLPFVHQQSSMIVFVQAEMI